MVFCQRLIKKASELSSIDDKIEFCNILADSIEGIETNSNYLTRNTDINNSLYNRIKNEIPNLLSQNKSPEEVNGIFWSGAYVLESLPFALYSFLYSASDFRTTLLNAVNYSRDSDTVASIACSFSGALNGLDSIENYYIDNLEYKDYLLELADKLLIKENNL